MKSRVIRNCRKVGLMTAGTAFLASLAFFLLVYPYHLIRREQMNLFVFNWDYIFQRFRGIGWLARLAGSFFEQFFCFKAIGALTIALLLTATGIVVYRILRRFLGRRISLVIAALIFLWSFLRECGNLYLTRYTIATLGLLSLILLILQSVFPAGRHKTSLSAASTGITILCIGLWALGAPCDKVYGKLWGWPEMESEKLFALDTEVVRENWDRVLKLTEKDVHTVESSLCYNLALAMKGQLGKRLFDKFQDGPERFLLSVSGDYNIFANGLAGEQWYQLGNMTVAEQSAITVLQASPEHTGARFIERLARINIITGQMATAQKYLSILSKTSVYRKWACRMLDGNLTEEDKTWIEKGRNHLAVSDFIYTSNIIRATLQNLLEANPDNTPAREYLLCYDLLRYDLEQFMEDYETRRLGAGIYKEAVVLWLGQDGFIPQKALDEYGLDNKLKQRMDNFSRHPNKYTNTYWYYYLNAMSK